MPDGDAHRTSVGGDEPVILLASSNPHKLIELRALLAGTGSFPAVGVRVVTPGEIALALEVPETGATFVENAITKAEAFCAASGLPSIADDSGLVVDALGGRPGVLSARFGGEGRTDADRTNLVLAELAGVPEPLRTARFVAVVALAVPGQVTQTFEGTVEGRITTVPLGSGGFGYDPIFFYPPAGRTFAQLSASQKAKVGHRGRAMAQLVEPLQRLIRERYTEPAS